MSDLDRLTTEARLARAADLDRLSPHDLVRLMNDEDAGIARAVAAEQESIAAAVAEIAARFGRGGRLFYVGAGTSGRLGVLDAVECGPTFCAPPGQVVGVLAGGADALLRSVEGAEDDRALGDADLTAHRPMAADAVVGITASGRTPYVLGAIDVASAAGAFTIGLSCNAGSPLARAVALAITPVVGPEVLSGSTRLKAGTATKMVLNMLSTGAMVRCGKAYGNLMVDVQATNDKLRARARRIVREVTGLDDAGAAQLLVRCDGELKTALVAQQRGLEPGAARALLTEHGGVVRSALEA